MHSMKAIIPTGGRGTRMQPLTFSANKHFIPVANKPLIYYPIEAVADAGIREVLITYNPGWLDFVKKELGDGKRWGLKFRYVLQEEPLGLANIVQVCEEALEGSPFVFHLGDNIFADGINQAVSYFEKHKANGLVMMLHHPENGRLGVPYFDKDGRLKKYVEKPKNPPHDFAVPGLYFADKNFFKAFRGVDKIKPSVRGEFEIPSPFQWLIKHGYRVDVIEYKGKWLDPGKFGDWIESNQYLLDRFLQSELGSAVCGSRVEGRVSLGKKCEIKKSEIRGPVAIGDRVRIINSYVGPFSSISDRCVIENSHVENSVLMRGVVVKNIKQPISESLIGPDAEIVDEDGPTDWVKLFVGEKSKVKI
jgi:glucose-1-phosphate thymidylyltransferase